jgi:hypothetical protein
MDHSSKQRALLSGKQQERGDIVNKRQRALFLSARLFILKHPRSQQFFITAEQTGNSAAALTPRDLGRIRVGERELSDEILSACSPPRQMHPSLIWFQDTREKSRVNLIIDEAAGKERD